MNSVANETWAPRVAAGFLAAVVGASPTVTASTLTASTLTAPTVTAPTAASSASTVTASTVTASTLTASTLTASALTARTSAAVGSFGLAFASGSTVALTLATLSLPGFTPLFAGLILEIASFTSRLATAWRSAPGRSTASAAVAGTTAWSTSTALSGLQIAVDDGTDGFDPSGDVFIPSRRLLVLITELDEIVALVVYRDRTFCGPGRFIAIIALSGSSGSVALAS